MFEKGKCVLMDYQSHSDFSLIRTVGTYLCDVRKLDLRGSCCSLGMIVLRCEFLTFSIMGNKQWTLCDMKVRGGQLKHKGK